MTHPIFTEGETGHFYAGPAIPVHIESSSARQVREVSPEFTTCMDFNPVAQINVAVPTQILQRRLRRAKANVIIRTGAAATDIYFNNNPAPLQAAVPSGVHFRIGASSLNTSFPDWLSQQPLYVISSQPDTEVIVVDNSYGSHDESDYVA